MWVARTKNIDGTTNNKNLSPKFESIYDCQKYIDQNLQVLEFLLTEVLRYIDFNIDYKNDKKLKIRWGNMIRCYNLEQERFCDSYDF